MSEIFPIDAVITWVDGADRAHRAKRLKYMNGGIEAKQEDIGGETRFNQVGEIYFCVASILRFAPFIRKIFIVTDNQNPQLDDFIAQNFPDNKVAIEIVDHMVIFRGYEQYLPTFNSLTITTMLWRIPGLSEHFLLLNDDIMFATEVTPADFFDGDGNPVCYASRMPTWLVKAIHWLKPSHNGRKAFGFKDAQFNAQRLAGWHGSFLYMGHTPHTLRRSFFEDYFSQHPDVLVGQICHRFREHTQFSAVCLQYISLYMQGRCRVEPLRGKSVTMNPKGNDINYFRRKLRELTGPKIKFFCVNSLDKATDEERALLYETLTSRLGIKLPQQ